MKIPTTLDRKKMKKWLTRPALAIVLALLLVLSSLPVYAGEQQTEQTETPTVTQDAGSESAQSATSSEQNEPLAEELDVQNAAIAATTELQEDPPYEGAVLNGGYVGFKNKASGKYLTIPNGSTTVGTNVCQQSANNVANAQEFYLSYTHNAKKSISYFTIWPVDDTGSTTQTRVKAASLNATSNVSLQCLMPTEITDRWQIEHVSGNYYCIYIAISPNSSGTKYALTANPGNGTADDVTNEALGNVFVSAYTGSNNQLWQICVNTQDIDINKVNILEDSAPVIDTSESIQYFYVPKHFNTTTNWNCYSRASINPQNGLAIGLQYGTATISVAEIDSGGMYKEYHSSSLHIVPSNGAYYIGNKELLEYVSLQSESTAMIRMYIRKFSTNDIEKWYITRAADNPGYVYLISAYSGMYMVTDNTNATTVRQVSLPSDYTLWKIETSNEGNMVFKCKGTEASGLVLTVASNGNSPSSESPLSMAVYSNNSNYLDEWMIYSFNAYTVNLSVLYDYSYNNRFTEAKERIENQISILQRKYLEEFGILVNVSSPALFASYVNTYCTTNPTQVCSHTTNDNCDNSVTCTDGTILFGELHHNNVYNMLLHTPLTDMSESLRLVYLGHDNCVMSTVTENGATEKRHVSGDLTVLGLAYTKLGLCGVMNFGTPANETKTMLHEFGHLYGVDDHYGGNGKTTQDLILEGKTGYSEYCIYGENRNSPEVLENYTICDGCKALIESNYNRYDH